MTGLNNMNNMNSEANNNNTILVFLDSDDSDSEYWSDMPDLVTTDEDDDTAPDLDYEEEMQQMILDVEQELYGLWGKPDRQQDLDEELRYFKLQGL